MIPGHTFVLEGGGYNQNKFLYHALFFILLFYLCVCGGGGVCVRERVLVTWVVSVKVFKI